MLSWLQEKKMMEGKPMKTLHDLALQYKSDVETRIEVLQDGVEEILLSPVLMTEDMREDYDAQIGHWQTTLKEIDEVLQCHVA